MSKKRLGYETDIIGTQNVCEAVSENPLTKVAVLISSWHTMGEYGLKGIIDEGFGYAPDKVEDRARLYALAKIAQEVIFRFFDEMTEKIFGIVRLGTVLGEGMPEKTAANIFIRKAIGGQTLTPYAHSAFRPMVYVDVMDVCKGIQHFITRGLNGEIKKHGNSLSHIINLFYPEPITVIELAKIIKNGTIKYSNNRINPSIEIVDLGLPTKHTKVSKKLFKINITNALTLLDIKNLTPPKKAIEQLIMREIRRSAHNL